jgi:hypothetical protein
MGLSHFKSLFGAINVENAEASKVTDREAILHLMREIGINKVNDVVKNSVREWMSFSIRKAKHTPDDKALAWALNADGALHEFFVSA